MQPVDRPFEKMTCYGDLNADRSPSTGAGPTGAGVIHNPAQPVPRTWQLYGRPGGSVRPCIRFRVGFFGGGSLPKRPTVRKPLPPGGLRPEGRWRDSRKPWARAGIRHL